MPRSMMKLFLWIYLTALYVYYISSIIDVRLGYVYASENIEIFKVKLRWNKSSRLLQRIAFLVSFTVVITGEPMSALCLQHYFDGHENFYISSSSFYFSFVIDNAKPTYLDCVNSNICSFILSLLKLHGTFCFMNQMCYIYLILTKLLLVRSTNLFAF